VVVANRRRGPDGDKRRRILDAAVEAFGTRGYSRTRVSDIAKTANVADGTVYLYFDGKEGLLTAIFEDLMERFLDLARDALEHVQGAPAKLRRLFELHLDHLGSNRKLATVFQIEFRHSSRFMETFSRGQLRDYFELVADILDEGRLQGTVRSDLDPWFATKCIFGVVDEAATNWVLSEREYRLVAVLDDVMSFITGGIAPRR
jgi:TetR/AcrR family fatty acid metabolism transcriptional regulator